MVFIFMQYQVVNCAILCHLCSNIPTFCRWEGFSMDDLDNAILLCFQQGSGADGALVVRVALLHSLCNQFVSFTLSKGVPLASLQARADAFLVNIKAQPSAWRLCIERFEASSHAEVKFWCLQTLLTVRCIAVRCSILGQCTLSAWCRGSRDPRCRRCASIIAPTWRQPRWRARKQKSFSSP